MNYVFLIDLLLEFVSVEFSFISDLYAFAKFINKY